MDTHLAAVFWSVLLFEAKHFLCDFVLQTRYQLLNKGIYGHPAGLVHAGTHAIGSLPALIVLTHSSLFISVLLIGEFLVQGGLRCRPIGAPSDLPIYDRCRLH